MFEKRVCPKCQRHLRTRCFVFNPVLKEKICRRCDKRIGHNIFYEPTIKGAKKRIIKKFWNFTSWFKRDERDFIEKKMEKNGLDREQAMKKMKEEIKMIQSIVRKEHEVKEKIDNKKLIEGLK